MNKRISWLLPILLVGLWPSAVQAESPAFHQHASVAEQNSRELTVFVYAHFPGTKSYAQGLSLEVNGKHYVLVPVHTVIGAERITIECARQQTSAKLEWYATKNPEKCDLALLMPERKVCERALDFSGIAQDEELVKQLPSEGKEILFYTFQSRLTPEKLPFSGERYKYQYESDGQTVDIFYWVIRDKVVRGGMSGAPVFTSTGQLTGMVSGSGKVLLNGQEVNIGVVISNSTIRWFLQEFLKVQDSIARK